MTAHHWLPAPPARIGSRAALLLSGLLLTSVGCKGDKNGDSGAADAGRSSLELYPPEGGLGVEMEVDFTANSSTFDFTSEVGADFGAGVEVLNFEVDDGWRARASILVSPDAELGARDVKVNVGDANWTISDGFRVVAESFEVLPDSARMGETLTVDLLGSNTAWEGGVTWPSFGDGVDVEEFTVLTPTLAQARVAVSVDSSPGWRNVTMDNGGGDRVVSYDGFLVDRVALAATFDPPFAEQGDTVEFTIKARGTDFLSGTPRLGFRDRFGDNPDIVIDNITVIDAENLYGRMTLSNASALGMRDVQVSVGDEGVAIPDAFEVLAGGWDVSNVAVDLSFNVVRVRDNDSGELSERVNAQVTFYIPLDPPCPIPETSAPNGCDGTDPACNACNDEYDGDGDGWVDCEDLDCVMAGACPATPPEPIGEEPSPYDANGVTGAISSGGGGTVGNGPYDCPFPVTVPAGDFVWFESDANVVTLEKTYDPDSGIVYYVDPDATMDDYVAGQMYDLHTQGEEAGLPEYLIEEVIPTVPSDWHWTFPELWGNYTHDRTTDFVFRWTPARTYPDAIFVMTIFNSDSPGPLSIEGASGWGGAYPWDDGEHAMSAGHMSMFAPGTVPVYTYSFVTGPEFGLPDSIYQQNQVGSYIYLVQQMVLE